MNNGQTSLSTTEARAKNVTLETEPAFINRVQCDQTQNESTIEVCPPNAKYHLSYNVGHLPDSLSIDIFSS